MFHSLITIILYEALKKAYENGQITKVEVALRESEGWFRAIFNQERQRAGGRRQEGILTQALKPVLVTNLGLKTRRLHGAYNWVGSESPTKKFLLPDARGLANAALSASCSCLLQPLSRACWSDFSRDMEDLSPNLSPKRREALNSRPISVGKLAQRLGLLLIFPHNVKSQARWWTIPKGIQAQLGRVIRRASTS